MVEGSVLFVILLLAVLFIVVSSSVFKLHPFLGLLLASLGVGVAVGIPLQEVVATINKGFGGLMGYIGLIVVLGSVIGVVLEKSGAAIRIADLIVGLFGKKRPTFAMALIGSVVGVPVFCDSGFIILSRLTQVIGKKTGVGAGTLSLGLAGGLYTTHTLVPPTPGPIAAAGNLGAAEYLGTIILVGLLISIPTLFVVFLAAERLGKKIDIEIDTPEPEPTAKELPSITRSLLPIGLPILLIAMGSLTQFFQWQGILGGVLLFLGNPLIALLCGLLSSFMLFKKLDEEHLNGWIGKGVGQAGPILLLTGAGGAFGAVLKATPISSLVEAWVIELELSSSFFLVMAFVVAALLKSSQGSSTSALVITSSMIAPMVTSLGMDAPLGYALLVMAIGGGAMTVSHANDSFFWVVSQFSGIKMKDAYRSFTLLTLIQGITVLTIVLILSLLLL